MTASDMEIYSSVLALPLIYFGAAVWSHLRGGMRLIVLRGLSTVCAEDGVGRSFV